MYRYIKRRAEDVGEVAVEEMGVFSGGSGGGGKSGGGGGGGGLVGSLGGMSLSGGGGAFTSADPAVQAELASQEAAIKANQDRVKLIELVVGSLDGVML